MRANSRWNTRPGRTAATSTTSPAATWTPKRPGTWTQLCPGGPTQYPDNRPPRRGHLDPGTWTPRTQDVDTALPPNQKYQDVQTKRKTRRFFLSQLLKSN